MHQKTLLNSDFEGAVSTLTHLPDSIRGAEIFRNIEPFMRSYPASESKSKKRFSQVRLKLVSRK